MLGGRSLGRKCGMEGVDKEYINQVIEAKSSANYKAFNEKKTLEMQAKLAEMKEQLEKASVGDRQKATQYAAELVEQYEAERDLSRVIVHLDMDAFFAAVEQRDDPSLRKIPFAVGSTSMISTSNYIARSRGVRSAMPGYIGRSLCPELKFVPVNINVLMIMFYMEKYREAAHEVRELFAEYDPTFHPGGLDEATLDFTEHLRTRNSQHVVTAHRFGGDCECRLPLWTEEDAQRFPDAAVDERVECPGCKKERVAYRFNVTFGNTKEDAVNELRFRVEHATGLTCSAGIANNGLLAKICSDEKKPNDQFVLQADRQSIMDYLQPLDTRRLPGVGPSLDFFLKGLDIKTCGDILERQADIALLFSDNQTHFLIRSALGIGRQYEESDENVGRQTISSERTFAETSNLEFLEGLLNDCVRNAFESMLEDGYTGCSTVTFKLKLHTFELLSRGRSSFGPMSSIPPIAKVAKMLMLEMVKGKRVRLIGVTLSNFVMARQKQKSIDGFIQSTKSPAAAQDDDEIVFEKVVRKPKKSKAPAPKKQKSAASKIKKTIVKQPKFKPAPPRLFGQPLPQKVPTKQTKINFPRVRSPPNRAAAPRPNGNADAVITLE